MFNETRLFYTNVLFGARSRKSVSMGVKSCYYTLGNGCVVEILLTTTAIKLKDLVNAELKSNLKGIYLVKNYLVR